MTSRYIPYLGKDFATVVLSKGAPVGGVKVDLWLDDDTIATIPDTIAIAEDSNIGMFDVNWLKEGSTVLHAQVVERPIGTPVTEAEMPSLTIVCGVEQCDLKPQATYAVELKPRSTGARKA